MTTNADRRSVVDRIRRKNEDEFGEGARAAVQKLLSAGLPHPWMYIYELTQNALDAGARRIHQGSGHGGLHGRGLQVGLRALSGGERLGH